MIQFCSLLCSSADVQFCLFILVYECLSSSALQDLLKDYYVSGDLLMYLS